MCSLCDNIVCSELSRDYFSVHPLLFHCEYNIDRLKLAELDIKWYLGSSPSPFMVFLPHLQKEPQVVDHRFREKIVFSEGVWAVGS